MCIYIYIYINVCMCIIVGNLFEMGIMIFLSLRVRLSFMCKLIYLGRIVSDKFWSI